MAVEVVHVYRGNTVDNIHKGDIIAVNSDGETVFEYGSGLKKAFWRASAKPFQVIPFIESGGMDEFNITMKELAIMCGSHNGEEKHVKVVEDILNKMGKIIDDLDCGVSRPVHEGEYRRCLRNGKEFTQAMNNCSGKHTSMLGYGTLNGIDLENYIDRDHSIQKKMLKTISEITKVEEKDIEIAIDGCGVPLFKIPLYNMGLAYALLANPDNHERKAVLKTIAIAMTGEPFYVAGTDRLDTILMQELKDKIIGKLGAQSVYCISILGKGIGIAIKVEDGNSRVLDCLVPNLLLKHGYITREEYNRINARLSLEVKNHRRETVGKMVSCIY